MTALTTVRMLALLLALDFLALGGRGSSDEDGARAWDRIGAASQSSPRAPAVPAPASGVSWSSESEDDDEGPGADVLPGSFSMLQRSPPADCRPGALRARGGSPPPPASVFRPPRLA